MRRTLTIALFCLAASAQAGIYRTGGPATTDNDASCDISVMPAATLLLPYFEVDINAAGATGENTLFTVANVTQYPQIAHVTLWTDFGYPVIDFPIFLTGYDVQSISLYDVIARGKIAPDDGTGLDVSPVGELSGDSEKQIPHDNPLVLEAGCVDLPIDIPAVYVDAMQRAFTQGRLPTLGLTPACNTVGGVHSNAIGYLTIDVVGECISMLATEAGYFTDLIRFDNVLTGDYVQINGQEDFAQGNPLVHIRAIPEGGTPQTRAGDTNYRVHAPRTFYSRYLPASMPGIDARQPLPATFYARWISGGATGFETDFKIWREGRSTSSTACSAYPAFNGALRMTEIVRFDEEENPETLAPPIFVTPIEIVPVIPATGRHPAQDDSIFPYNSFGAVSGWMYLNLDSPADEIASQNWIVSSMRAEDRFSVDIDATTLGNGCSAPVPSTNAIGGAQPIGPAPNVRP